MGNKFVPNYFFQNYDFFNYLLKEIDNQLLEFNMNSFFVKNKNHDSNSSTDNITLNDINNLYIKNYSVF